MKEYSACWRFTLNQHALNFLLFLNTKTHKKASQKKEVENVFELQYLEIVEWLQ